VRGFAPAGVDARPLALLRIGLGAFIVSDLADRLRDFHAFYTSAALVPAPAARDLLGWLQHWSVLAISNDSRVTLAIYLLAFPAALLVALGLFTRPALVATLIALVSLHHRNPYIDGGGDAVLRALVFWMIFVDASARLSLDVGLGRRAARAAVPGLPVLLLQLQIALVYIFAFLGKSGPGWRDGSAVLLALTTSDWARGAGPWLATHPLLCRGLTFATLIIEAAFAPMVLWPFRSGRHHLRAVALAAGVALHAGIYLTMRVGNFSQAMILSYLAFVPGAWLDRLIPRLAAQGFDDASAPPPPAPLAIRSPRGFALAALFAVVLAGQLTAVVLDGIPRPLAATLEAIGMRQDWRVFAPDAPRIDVTFTAPGQLTNGEAVELTQSTLAQLAPQRGFRYSRWHRLRNMLVLAPPELASALGRYVCRRHDGLAHFDLIAHIQSPTAPPQTQLRLEQTCAPAL
jgi:hypothetical protein